MKDIIENRGNIRVKNEVKLKLHVVKRAMYNMYNTYIFTGRVKRCKK